MSMKLLVVAIVLTIVYLCFSAWNVFIAKKAKTKVSIADIIYAIFLMFFTGLISSMTIIIGIEVAFMLWLVITLEKGRSNCKAE